MRSQQQTIETIDGVGIPKKRKKKIIALVIVMVLGVYSGFLLGNFVISQRSDPNRYNYDVSALMDDVSTIRLLANGRTPQSLGATKSCVLAFDTTFNYENVQVTGDGLIIANVGPIAVEQTVDARTIRVGNRMFNENISISSFVQATNRYYVENDNIEHYGGKISGNEIIWNTTADTPDEIKTMELYTQKYGVPMNYYMTYIVSSKTVVDASEVTVNDDGNYEFTLTLDKVKSVINYVKSMKDTGGLSDYPDFVEDPIIKLTIDSNYRILRFESVEVYSAKLGIITASLSGGIINTFSYDEQFEIPGLSENSVIG